MDQRTNGWTDGPTDGPTDQRNKWPTDRNTSYWVAWPQLKRYKWERREGEKEEDAMVIQQQVWWPSFIEVLFHWRQLGKMNRDNDQCDFRPNKWKKNLCLNDLELLRYEWQDGSVHFKNYQYRNMKIGQHYYQNYLIIKKDQKSNLCIH